MVWLYRSPIPVGRRGVISIVQVISIPAFPRIEEGGEVGTLCSVPAYDAVERFFSQSKDIMKEKM
jgi:hypothetical protein